jgi:hypothetical protein
MERTHSIPLLQKLESLVATYHCNSYKNSLFSLHSRRHRTCAYSIMVQGQLPSTCKIHRGVAQVSGWGGNRDE